MKHHRSSFFRPRSIRGQLARLVLVAIAVELSLLTVMVVNAISAYRQASDTSTAVTLEVTDQAFMHELQKERGLTLGLLGGDEQFRSQLPAQRARTDSTLAALNHLMADPAYATPAAQLRPELARVNALADVRDAADHGRIDRNAALQYFNDTNIALNQPDLGFDRAEDATLRYNLLALRTLGNAKESTGEERALMDGVFAAGHFDGNQFIQFTQFRADQVSGVAEFDRYATPEQRGRLEAAMQSPVAQHMRDMENVALAQVSGRIPVGAVNAFDWHTTLTHHIDDLRTVQLAIGDDALNRVRQLESNATWELAGALALALITVGAEVLLVIGASRSIIRPLEALSKEADEMATRRLPDAVERLERSTDEEPAEPKAARPPDRASAEIRVVADSFNRVQHTAFTIASKHALIRRNTTESLANLGRRNQNLVRRQLGLISKFEHDELDPSALANLFDLDHLATRMRRNAESLLVLVGKQNPRRWSEPMPIIDVIRAALSEVEDYRRVTLRRVDDALVVGAVASEVAHLLAELIENGLSFSPPDADVEVYARRNGSEYLLAVVDQGVGMSEDAIALANARLAGDEHFLVAPTRFLGHFVVGGLARGLGAHVELSRSPVQGITARVTLPSDVLAAPTDHSGKHAKNGQATNGSATNGSTADGQSAAQAQTVTTSSHTPTPTPRSEPRSSTPEPSYRMGFSGSLDETASSPPADSENRTPESSAYPEASPSHTRNGLVKRVRRKQGAKSDVAPAAPQTSPTEERPDTTRSPEDVRAMLSAFRSGHRRGAEAAEKPAEATALNASVASQPPSSPEEGSP